MTNKRNGIEKKIIKLLLIIVMFLGVIKVYGDFGERFMESFPMSEQIFPTFAQVWQASTGKVYNSCLDINADGMIDAIEKSNCSDGVKMGETLTGVWTTDVSKSWGDDSFSNDPLSGPNDNNIGRQPSLYEMYNIVPVPNIAEPRNLVALSSGGVVYLNWYDFSGNESGFRIERCMGVSCNDFTEIGSVGKNIKTYIDGTVQSTTTYIYRVRAYNPATYSDYSNITNITTD